MPVTDIILAELERVAADDTAWHRAGAHVEQASKGRAAAMADAYVAGATLAQVASAAGVTHPAVHRCLTRAGFSPARLRGLRSHRDRIAGPEHFGDDGQS